MTGTSCSPRVICVDDQDAILTVWGTILSRLGCEVFEAANSDSCLDGLRQHRIDVAIIDYHLNDGIDGEQLARQIRAAYPSIGLILLTGHVRVPESAYSCFDRVFIKGGSNPQELAHAVHELAARAR
jgi:CheY-like chemotaxis protein